MPTKNLSRIEKWILRLLKMHFVLLVFAQILTHYKAILPYINKAVRYEGVAQTVSPKAVKNRGTGFGHMVSW